MPQSSITFRSQERTIAMLRRKLKNTETCLNRTKLRVTEILHFVDDTDITDSEDVALSNNFVISKSNEILNMTPENYNDYSEDDTENDTELDSDYGETSEDEMSDGDMHDGDMHDGDMHDDDMHDDDMHDGDMPEMPELVDDMPDSDMYYDDMPELIDGSDSEEESDLVDDNNVFNYDFTYLNHQTSRFENIYMDGIHYYHDKYGDITGYVNLLLVFDSNQDLEAVGVYNPNLDIESSLPFQD
jgi:hypothetical protein